MHVSLIMYVLLMLSLCLFVCLFFSFVLVCLFFACFFFPKGRERERAWSWIGREVGGEGLLEDEGKEDLIKILYEKTYFQ